MTFFFAFIDLRLKLGTNHLYQSMKSRYHPTEENIFSRSPRWSDDFMEKVWYAYLVNDKDFLMESVMVVSKAIGTII
jgi:hypothetical protein